MEANQKNFSVLIEKSQLLSLLIYRLITISYRRYNTAKETEFSVKKLWFFKKQNKTQRG
jgi:hypothetical protein